MIDMAIVMADSSRDTLHFLVDEATIKTSYWLTASELTEALKIERPNFASALEEDADDVVFIS